MKGLCCLCFIAPYATRQCAWANVWANAMWNITTIFQKSRKWGFLTSQLLLVGPWETKEITKDYINTTSLSLCLLINIFASCTCELLSLLRLEKCALCVQMYVGHGCVILAMAHEVYGVGSYCRDTGGPTIPLWCQISNLGNMFVQPYHRNGIEQSSS